MAYVNVTPFGIVVEADGLANVGPDGIVLATTPATLAGSIAETGTAADAPSAVAVFPVTVAESGSATDAPSAISTRAAAVAETLSAASTTSAVAPPKRGYLGWARFQTANARPAVMASLAETLAATTTSTATGGGAASVTAETLAATDHPSASGGSVPAFASETLAATDTTASFIAVRVYLSFATFQAPAPSQAGVVAETATAADTTDAISNRVAARAEVLAAADALSVQTDFAPIAAEVLAAADTASAIGGAAPVDTDEFLSAGDGTNAVGGVTLAESAETLAPADAQSAIKITAVTVAETGILADTLNGVAAATAIETLSATDAPDALILFAGSIAEGTASIADLTAADVLWAAATSEIGLAADSTEAEIAGLAVFETQPKRRFTTKVYRPHVG